MFLRTTKFYKTMITPARPELLKLFINNNICSAIIGIKGKNLKNFQEQAKVVIIMTKYGQYYPGTTDRIMSIRSDVMEESEAEAYRRIFSAATCIFDCVYRVVLD